MSDDDWVQLKPVVGRLVPDVKASVHVRNDGAAVVTLSFSEHFVKKAAQGTKRCTIVANPSLFAVRITFEKDGGFEMTELGKGGARVRMPAFAKALESDCALLACRTESTATLSSYIVHLPKEWLEAPRTQPHPSEPESARPVKVAGAALTAEESNGGDGGKVDLIRYMNFRGHRCRRLSAGQFELDKEKVTIQRLLESANLIRKKAGLPNFLAGEVEG